MRIEIVGDDSISRQARIYAEYRLFAAVSQAMDTSRVRTAALVLRRSTSGRYGDRVVCTVTIETDDGNATRVRTLGEHPYAAINRAVERLRLHSRPVREDSGPRELVVTE
jgi:ribosome-associated translation inhibitor RaiA